MIHRKWFWMLQRSCGFLGRQNLGRDTPCCGDAQPCIAHPLPVLLAADPESLSRVSVPVLFGLHAGYISGSAVGEAGEVDFTFLRG